MRNALFVPLIVRLVSWDKAQVSAPQSVAPESPLAAKAALEQARAAFKSQDWARSETLFRQCLKSGVEEAECRLHLARICNGREDWAGALEHWQWLSANTPRRI